METAKELLKLQTGGELMNTDNQNSTELIKTHQVENTGFCIIEVQDKGCFVTLGMYRLTEYKETIEECLRMIEEKDWELILGLMGAVQQHSEKELTTTLVSETV